MLSHTFLFSYEKAAAKSGLDRVEKECGALKSRCFRNAFFSPRNYIKKSKLSKLNFLKLVYKLKLILMNVLKNGGNFSS
jgi:hypothetical protein